MIRRFCSEVPSSEILPPMHSSSSQDHVPPPFSLLDFSTWVEGEAKVPRSDLVTLLQGSQREYLALAKGYYGAKYDAKKDEEVQLSWKEIIRQVEFQRDDPIQFYKRLQHDYTYLVEKHIISKTAQEDRVWAKRLRHDALEDVPTKDFLDGKLKFIGREAFKQAVVGAVKIQIADPPRDFQSQRAYVFTTPSGCGKTRGLFEIEPALREIEGMPNCWSVYIGFNCTFRLTDAEKSLLGNQGNNQVIFTAECILLNRLLIMLRLRCSGKKHSELPDDSFTFPVPQGTLEELEYLNRQCLALLREHGIKVLVVLVDEVPLMDEYSVNKVGFGSFALREFRRLQWEWR
eukprot:PhF_6_TR8069/c0_g2_i1/m.12486